MPREVIEIRSSKHDQFFIFASNKVEELKRAKNREMVEQGLI